VYDQKHTQPFYGHFPGLLSQLAVLRDLREKLGKLSEWFFTRQLVLASDSQHRGSNAPSISTLVVDEGSLVGVSALCVHQRFSSETSGETKPKEKSQTQLTNSVKLTKEEHWHKETRT